MKDDLRTVNKDLQAENKKLRQAYEMLRDRLAVFIEAEKAKMDGKPSWTIAGSLLDDDCLPKKILDKDGTVLLTAADLARSYRMNTNSPIVWRMAKDLEILLSSVSDEQTERLIKIGKAKAESGAL